MSKFTLSINLDHVDQVSDLAAIAEIFTSSGLDKFDPSSLIGLLTRLNLGIQRKPFAPGEPGPMMGKLDEIDIRKWLYIANKFEEIAGVIKDNVPNA